jgi:predicted DNA-binding transcriptional regulator AlpA
MMLQTQNITPTEVVALIASKTGIGFTPKRLFNFVRSGKFPEPTTRVNPKTIFWTRSEVEDWIKKNFPGHGALKPAGGMADAECV